MRQDLSSQGKSEVLVEAEAGAVMDKEADQVTEEIGDKLS
jgi:hypothetical protein